MCRWRVHGTYIRQTGCDIMSVLVSQEADVLLANLAYGHDNTSLVNLFVMS